MDTRDRLVDAMSTSMRQRGYGSSAMKDVLDEADATAGSMYHFFPEGKEQLAVAAITEVGRATTEGLAAIIDDSPSVAHGTVVFYEALIRDMEATEFRFGCPIGVPSTEVAFVSDGIREAGAAVFSSWVAAIAAGLEAEGWEPAEALRAARFCVSAYEGASTLSRATHDTSYLRDTLAIVGDVLSR